MDKWHQNRWDAGKLVPSASIKILLFTFFSEAMHLVRKIPEHSMPHHNAGHRYLFFVIQYFIAAIMLSCIVLFYNPVAGYPPSLVPSQPYRCCLLQKSQVALLTNDDQLLYDLGPSQ
jgi:hypothetical protein